MANSTPGMSEKLVAYLDGELQGAGREQLEQQLQTDAALQEQWQQLLLSREAVRQYGLREQVANVRASMNKEQAPVRPISDARRIIRYVISVAASIVLVVLGVMGYNFYQLSPTKVFNEQYTRYEISTTRGGGLSSLPIERAYREKHYAEVIASANNSKDTLSLLLAGMAQLELKNYSAAARNYKQVIELNEKAGTRYLKDEAEYYLALAYLADKDYDLSLDQLQKIHADETHVYHVMVKRKLIRQVKLLKWR